MSDKFCFSCARHYHSTRFDLCNRKMSRKLSRVTGDWETVGSPRSCKDERRKGIASLLRLTCGPNGRFFDAK